MSTTDSLFVNHLIIFDKISEREIPLVHASELYTTHLPGKKLTITKALLF